MPFLGIYDDCKVHIVPGCGHANTAGIRVDLAALMRERFGFTQVVRNATFANINSNSENNHGLMMGMEKRYDEKSFGLSPLLYWRPNVYSKYDY